MRPQFDLQFHIPNSTFDNTWTLRLTSALRFHFVNDSSMSKLWIEDREQPEKREWLLDRTQQKTEDYKDYAIVARFIPPDTDCNRNYFHMPTSGE
jgi:hypothetical protein